VQSRPGLKSHHVDGYHGVTCLFLRCTSTVTLGILELRKLFEMIQESRFIDLHV
jgi:hypothetical protein